jgi:hypothetical protein
VVVAVLAGKDEDATCVAAPERDVDPAVLAGCEAAEEREAREDDLRDGAAALCLRDAAPAGTTR